MIGNETLPHRLAEVAARRPAAPAYRVRIGGTWVTRTWAEVADAVEDLAAGLIARGIGPGDRVVIWAENSDRWAMADLAILSCGAVSVPIYASSPRAQAGSMAQTQHSRHQPQSRGLHFAEWVKGEGSDAKFKDGEPTTASKRW
jgi:long-subunit acyl-CoA synthetase (AMP-forming)